MQGSPSDPNRSALIATAMLVGATVLTNFILAVIFFLDIGILFLVIPLAIVPIANLTIFVLAVTHAPKATRGAGGWGIAYSVCVFVLPFGAGVGMIGWMVWNILKLWAAR